MIEVTVGAGLVRGVGVAVGQGAALSIGVGHHYADRARGMRRGRRRNRCAVHHSHTRGGRPSQLDRRSRQEAGAGDADCVPPVVVPEVGEIEVTVGAGLGVV